MREAIESPAIAVPAAADHAAEGGGIGDSLLFEDRVEVGAASEVTVEDEDGLWCDLVAEGDDGGDEFVVGGSSAHFLLRTEVDGEGGDILLK